MMRKLFLSCALAAVTSAAFADWYGGDFSGAADGYGNYAYGSWAGTLNLITYDDFNVGAGGAAVTEVWGNFMAFAAPSSTVYAEIRSGLTGSGLGTLVLSGTGTAAVTTTGRSVVGATEYQMRFSLIGILLPGLYHVGIQVQNQGTSNAAYVSNTVGTDLGPGSDPNPAPTGSPIANGNVFQLDVSSGVITGFNTDVSYGVRYTAVPEPSTVAAIAAGLGILLIRRKRK